MKRLICKKYYFNCKDKKYFYDLSENILFKILIWRCKFEKEVLQYCQL